MKTSINRRGFAARIAATAAATAAAASLPARAATDDRTRYANETDHALIPVMAAREKDWRIGAISYQVMVDRFVPSRHLDAKRALYPFPKRLRDWSEVPTAGPYVERQQVWQHEIDFWGGDLDSLMTRLDYVQGLGAEVLYLNPIHLAYTNHKYDALDYEAVSPEFGTRADVKRLADELHRRGMRLVLDGVFNHMGRRSRRASRPPRLPTRSAYGACRRRACRSKPRRRRRPTRTTGSSSVRNTPAARAPGGARRTCPSSTWKTRPCAGMSMATPIRWCGATCARKAWTAGGSTWPSTSDSPTSTS